MIELADTLNSLEKAWTENPFATQSTWLRTLQNNQLSDFLQRGFPTRQEEQWKYTDMSALAKQSFCWPKKIEKPLLPKEIKNSITIFFVNGYFSPELSHLSLLPKEVVLCTMQQALVSHAEIIQPILKNHVKEHPFKSLNTALMTDGIFLFVPKNTSISLPIHCIYLSTQQNHFMVHPCNIILASTNSKITFIEEYFAVDAQSYFTNTVTTLYAEENSQINYYKIQAEDSQATHVGNVYIQQKQDSIVKSFALAAGSRLGREDITVAVQAPGAECYLYGFYDLKNEGQHIDNHLYVHHEAAHGKSTMLYKGILDKKSRAVFNGKVHVYQGAQEIHAHQANHNLLLSNDAEINTKPELEIYADDVKCTHGATVGQLDAEALFYLQSRGIAKDMAMQLLAHAFSDEVFNKIENPDILQYIQQRVSNHVEL